MPAYLDCNATTPLEPRVRDVVLHHLDVEFGNAGSRTHRFGAAANRAVQIARDQVAALVAAQRDEVLFTSGATESNNVALLGLEEHGRAVGRRHIISTAIEHKAVLEPLERLAARGFEVELVQPDQLGRVAAEDVLGRLRPDTLLVSVMHANNETGAVQPLDEICSGLQQHDAFFHTDAAQGAGKLVRELQDPRLDLISVSGHKMYAPKGVGCLVARRRGYRRLPISPLMVGGGQERGLRPGTLPVALIAGIGLAAEIARSEYDQRAQSCTEFRERLLNRLAPLNPLFNGGQEHCLPHVVNLGFAGLDAEAAMVALKDVVAISNGSACTSHEYKPSHVLSAMGLPQDRISAALRFSWCHMTPNPDWDELVAVLRRHVRRRISTR